MPFQMALDEILFREFEFQGQSPKSGTVPPPAPLLRFYLSSEPWITVGYSQALGTVPKIGDSPQKHEACSLEHGAWSKNIPVCKRITGGGRVVHGSDIVFSLIAGKQADESFKSVRVSYWKLHEAVKAGFEKLDLKTRFYRCDEELPKGGDCFLFPIATDLEMGGKKIAGGAQKRSSGVLLHQESVQIPKGLEWRPLVEALQFGFTKVFNIQLKNMSFSPELLNRTQILTNQKGSDAFALKSV